MKKIIEISSNSQCIYRRGRTYVPISSKECWKTFIVCTKLSGIICPNRDEKGFPDACPLEDAP